MGLKGRYEGRQLPQEVWRLGDQLHPVPGRSVQRQHPALPWGLAEKREQCFQIPAADLS